MEILDLEVGVLFFTKGLQELEQVINFTGSVKDTWSGDGTIWWLYTDFCIVFNTHSFGLIGSRFL